MSWWAWVLLVYVLAVQTYPAWPDRWRSRGVWLVHGIGLLINVWRRLRGVA